MVAHRSLAPTYEKVGTDFKNDKHVIIAKMGMCVVFPRVHI